MLFSKVKESDNLVEYCLFVFSVTFAEYGNIKTIDFFLYLIIMKYIYAYKEFNGFLD